MLICLDICWIAWPPRAPRFSHNKVMKLNKTILYAAGAFFSLAFVGAFVGPRVSAAVRAALVEVVMPSNPFFDRLVLSPQNFLMSTGPNTGALGITNIPITNRDSTQNVVFILAPLFSGGGCGSTITGGQTHS